eukprot:TRINITY_DN3171_c0_g1_i3.p1 TRINITY_DN3171_c0_g1~~TRINITY_DN3171_c0_g1_i3.p1  ORF type:complete len:1066 (-),score=214.20 TRINITY_DN3171_c0_g1_i3:252-3425(-)
MNILKSISSYTASVFGAEPAAGGGPSPKAAEHEEAAAADDTHAQQQAAPATAASVLGSLRHISAAHYGMPAAPTCVAFDPVHQLCAVGGGAPNARSRGELLVKVLGRGGGETLCRVPSHGADSLLAIFWTGLVGDYVVVSTSGIFYCHLNQDVPYHALPYRHESNTKLSCSDHVFDSSVLAVGDAEGTVSLVLVKAQRAHDHLFSRAPGIPVTSVQCNPANEALVLVAFATKNEMLQTYDFHRKSAHVFKTVSMELVSAISWSRHGDKFVSAHEDGVLRIWDIASSKCTQQISVFQQLGTSLVRPQLVWTKLNKEEMLLISAGTPKSVKVLKLKSGELLQLYHCERWGSVTHFAASFTSPYRAEAKDPHHLISVTTQGALVLHSLASPSYPLIHLKSAAYITSNHPLTHARIYEGVTFTAIPVEEREQEKQQQQQEQEQQEQGQQEKQPPVVGPQAIPTLSGDLLLTGHDDGTVHLWRVLGPRRDVLSHVDACENPVEQMGPVATFDLAPGSGTLAAAYTVVTSSATSSTPTDTTSAPAMSDVVVYQYNPQQHGTDYELVDFTSEAPPATGAAAGDDALAVNPFVEAPPPRAGVASTAQSSRFRSPDVSPPGFQLKYRLHFGARVTCLKLCTAQRTLVVGADDGTLLLFDLASGRAASRDLLAAAVTSICCPTARAFAFAGVRDGAVYVADAAGRCSLRCVLPAAAHSDGAVVSLHASGLGVAQANGLPPLLAVLEHAIVVVKTQSADQLGMPNAFEEMTRLSTDFVVATSACVCVHSTAALIAYAAATTASVAPAAASATTSSAATAPAATATAPPVAAQGEMHIFSLPDLTRVCVLGNSPLSDFAPTLQAPFEPCVSAMGYIFTSFGATRATPSCLTLSHLVLAAATASATAPLRAPPPAIGLGPAPDIPVPRESKSQSKAAKKTKADPHYCACVMAYGCRCTYVRSHDFSCSRLVCHFRFCTHARCQCPSAVSQNCPSAASHHGPSTGSHFFASRRSVRACGVGSGCTTRAASRDGFDALGGIRYELVEVSGDQGEIPSAIAPERGPRTCWGCH